eukprot:m.130257 g.130257  ORF g.130257 m.130257 type:complete len:57 (+) comp15870_c1_seq17:99-269(+)
MRVYLEVVCLYQLSLHSETNITERTQGISKPDLSGSVYSCSGQRQLQLGIGHLSLS